MPSSNNEERFWSLVDRSGGPDSCWLWLGSSNAAGYGQFHWKAVRGLAHRYSYGITFGKVPINLELDHLCRVRPCVNPQHLEPVTHKENSRRGIGGLGNKIKTHCPSGHVYSIENTYGWGGRRYCRACMNLANRKRRGDGSPAIK